MIIQYPGGDFWGETGSSSCRLSPVWKRRCFPKREFSIGNLLSLPRSELLQMEICISQKGNPGEMFQFINTETTLLERHDLTAVKAL